MLSNLSTYQTVSFVVLPSLSSRRIALSCSTLSERDFSRSRLQNRHIEHTLTNAWRVNTRFPAIVRRQGATVNTCGNNCRTFQYVHVSMQAYGYVVPTKAFCPLFLSLISKVVKLCIHAGIRLSSSNQVFGPLLLSFILVLQ